MNPKDILKNLMKKRIAIASTIIFLITMLGLPSFQLKNEEITGTESPDLSFFYSTEDLYKMAEEYGQDGRKSYIQMRFTFDLIFPLVYGVFLFSSIGYLFKSTKYIPVVTLPIFGIVFDYLENISTSIVMWRYPENTPFVDVAATIFTPLKWIAISLGFLALTLGIVRSIYLRFNIK